MKPRISKPSHTPLHMVVASIGVVVSAIIILLPIIASQKKSVELLQGQIQALESDTALIGVSKEIFSSQQRKIEVIEDAFPDEETIPTFIGQFESVLKKNTKENKFKMTDAPISEAGRNYLLFTVNGQAEFSGFMKLLTDIEQLPYLIHIQLISLRTPEGLAKTVDFSFSMKLYVKNPFSIR